MSDTYRRRRVLVLEDDAREARATTRLLEDEGPDAMAQSIADATRRVLGEAGP